MQTIDDIFKDARAAMLTAEEKASHRARIAAFVAMTPVRGAAVRAQAPRRLPWFGFGAFSRTAGVAGLVGALTLSAAGVSYAAEGAVPGDVLYPVKVSVNEEVFVALATTEEKKAEVEAERAERRLAEAEVLVQRGTLTDDRRAEIETRFREHAESARVRAVRFGDQDAAAAEVAARLEGSLRAHRKIVAAIAAQRADDQKPIIDLDLDLGIGLGSVAAVDADDYDKAVPEKKVVTPSVTLTSQPVNPVIAAVEVAANAERRAKDDLRVSALRASAERAINAARAYLVGLRSKLGAEATAQAEQQLISAELLVGEGNRLAEADRTDEASRAFIRAQQIAHESRSLIRARGTLHVDVPFVRIEEPKEEHEEEREEERGDQARSEGGVLDVVPSVGGLLLGR